MAQLVIPVHSTFQNDLHPPIGGHHPVLYITTHIKKEILHSYVLCRHLLALHSAEEDSSSSRVKSSYGLRHIATFHLFSKKSFG